MKPLTVAPYPTSPSSTRLVAAELPLTVFPWPRLDELRKRRIGIDIRERHRVLREWINLTMPPRRREGKHAQYAILCESERLAYQAPLAIIVAAGDRTIWAPWYVDVAWRVYLVVGTDENTSRLGGSV